MEISEGRRLRELGIDPDGDPFEIMAAIYDIRDRISEQERLDNEAEDRGEGLKSE